MGEAYYADEHVTLHHGDAAATLATLEPGSVDCIVTSPPYFGLRDYGVDGQIGAEESPHEFVTALVSVFREARRVLADDGTLWVNLGDSYAAHQSNNGGYSDKSGLAGFTSTDTKGRRANDATVPRRLSPGVPPKNLLGVPWRVAFALQDDGWILRNDIIWSKPNAMPESVRDRLSARHEHIFLLTKSARYWFDLDPIREPLAYPAAKNTIGGKHTEISATRGGKYDPSSKGGGSNLRATGRQHLTPDTNGGRNPGDVWTFPTTPFPGAHFATFPVALPERCILAGCKPGGTVLDMFSGSGTTGLAATKHGRRYVGIDLNAEYLDLSLRTRLRERTLDLEGGAA